MDVKPPKTYEEQMALIEKKGFIVDDREACIAFLRQANYYRLSAYFLPFRKADNTFVQGIHFRRIQSIYEFNSRLRMLLFQAIEHIELYVRTQLSYYLGHHYGALGYLNDNIFSEKHDAVAFHKNIKQHIKENNHTLVVKHHMEKYEGKFPIWVIIEFFSMGHLSYLYADLIRKDQKAIAREAFGESSLCVKSWLRCVTELRNRCAHYSRIYYWTFPTTPRLPKNSPYDGRADRKLFTQILVLKYLYPDKKEWGARVVKDIEGLIQSYLPDIALEHIGFPDDWYDILRA